MVICIYKRTTYVRAGHKASTPSPLCYICKARYMDMSASCYCVRLSVAL